MSDEFPKPSGDCITDRKRQRAAEAKSASSFAAQIGSALCQNCKKRPATLDWVGDGGVMAWTHGMSERWCKVCALEAQLAHAKERAAKIPEMEARLLKLKSEVPNDQADRPEATK